MPRTEAKYVAPYFRKVVKLVDPNALTRKNDQVMGWPDYLVFWSRLAPWGTGMSFVELKTTTGGLSPRQDAIHDQIEMICGTRPVTLYGRGGVDAWLLGRSLTHPPTGTILFGCPAARPGEEVED